MIAAAAIFFAPAAAAQAQVKPALNFFITTYAQPTATPGRGSYYTAQLMNAGDTPVHNIRFGSTAPPDWTVEFEPANLAVLAPGATQIIGITVTPGSHTSRDNYNVTLTAQGDETGTVTSIYLMVQGGVSNWLWIGLGVAIAAILLFVFLFVRFNRH